MLITLSDAWTFCFRLKSHIALCVHWEVFKVKVFHFKNWIYSTRGEISSRIKDQELLIITTFWIYTRKSMILSMNWMKWQFKSSHDTNFFLILHTAHRIQFISNPFNTSNNNLNTLCAEVLHSLKCNHTKKKERIFSSLSFNLFLFM